MTYKEKMKKIKEMLKKIDFVDDSEIAIPIFCKHEDDLDKVYECLVNHIYTDPNDLSDYAFYLYMKRNHPNRIIEDDEQK